MKHTGTVSLETERLILRRFTLDDAQQAFDNWMSREKVKRYMTWQPYRNVEDVKGYCTKEYILKRKMMLARYGIRIREV